MTRTIAASVIALSALILSLPAQACVVADFNPCSVLSGPWRGYDHHGKRAKRPAKKGNIFRSYHAASASRSCLTANTRAVLDRLEARVGKVRIVSTCRPNAVIAGSGRPSFHRYGMAVDFHTRHRVAAVAFLQTQPVLVMTYSNMGHIHFNTGQKGTIRGANAYGGARSYRVRHASWRRR